MLILCNGTVWQYSFIHVVCGQPFWYTKTPNPVSNTKIALPNVKVLFFIAYLKSEICSRKSLQLLQSFPIMAV